MRHGYQRLPILALSLLFATGSAAIGQEEGKGVEPAPEPPREAVAVGGPDGYGYTYIDSAEVGGPAFSWVEISGSGTPLGLGDDGETNVTLPFLFPYYGVAHSGVRVGNNGGLLLGVLLGEVNFTNVCPLPSSAGSAAPRISVFWDDVDNDTGNVYHEAFANCPATQGGTGPCWVVEWFDRPHFNNVGDATFEAILWENGSILFQYLDTDFGNPNFDAGASASIGIEDDAQDASYFLSYSCNNTGAVPDSHAILFRPPAPACVQGFDGVTAPALPAGWSAVTIAGDAGGGWTNTGSLADTAPNRVTVTGQGGGTDDHALQSEVYPITSPAARLTFRHSYNQRNGSFAGVLETRIDGGAWQDILAAGGTFAQNGYNGVASGGPLSGRSAWTNSAQVTYVTVVVDLPAAMNGHDVEFRWRRGKNGNELLAFMTIDTVTVTGCSRCAVTCPANVQVGTDAPACSAAASFAPATGVGICLPLICSPASGSIFPLGDTPVVCGEGGGGSCGFNVTVVDDDAPLVMVPPPISVGTDDGVCSAVVGFNVTAVDNCDLAPVVACAPPSGSVFPVGTNPVACTATDAGGNVGNGGFNVTVSDDEDPTIVPLPDLMLDNDAGLCSAVATFSPTFGDNCPGATVDCVLPSGSAFPVGTSPVTCTVTDAAGMQTSGQFDVIVSDVEAPVVDAPDSVADNDPGLCSAVVSFTPTASDNCAVVGPISCVPPSGSAFPVGSTPGLCTADDAAGNQGSDPFTVTVNDVEPPVLICPADIELDVPPYATGGTVDFDDPVGSDNCPGLADPICDPASGTFFPVGTTTVDCSVEDASSNPASCSFDVTLNELSVLEVPTLGSLGLAALMLLLAGLAIRAMRIRGVRPR
ncbi:MAG: HYR domain-containing protein [Thermoanaerobaculia bacterium]